MSNGATTLKTSGTFWEILSRNWQTIVQLLLVIAVVHLYEIEGEAFSKVVILSSAGFIVSILMRPVHRLPLFAILSFIGIIWVLGPTDGGYLIGIGALLIGIVHLPIPMKGRLVLLTGTGALMAAFRSGWGAAPWSSAMWPILSSMFMFRLILYVRAVAAGKTERGFWGALAYFFMLPNVAFPLFPVVDYQTFLRTHFDRDESNIYEQGMLWIARGLMHLVLYRIIYYYVLNDPQDVVQLSDLVRYMLGTLLLYLKVSGQFHMIVGLLHLFGFRLPETHKLYYLSHSFTELWRRINIYWTEFMMKAFFYPTYFRVKQLGPTKALVVSTMIVFAATWFLHSYQWFWLRGGFPVTVQDTLFWTVLGALVIYGALKELKSVRTPKKKETRWNWRMGVRAAVTFLIFCFLWSLWSAQSFGLWLWTLGAASKVDPAGVVLLLSIIAVIMFFGGWDWEAIQKRPPKRFEMLTSNVTRTFAPLVVLVLIAQPAVLVNLPHGLEAYLQSLQVSRLNTQDAAAQHRGYYEQLDIRYRLTAATEGALGQLRDNWQTPASAGIIRERADLLTRDLFPDLDINWNGNRFTTNHFGMRDRDYRLEKPAGTYRIAFLGPSHVMGNGVSDHETFENLLEDSLNKNHVPAGFDRVEILNFGVDGYSIPQQLALLEDRVFRFQPDLVISTVYRQANTMTEGYLLKLFSRGVEPADGDLSSLCASAGLENIDNGAIPIPFQPLRNLAKKMGVSARMPSAEIAGRIHRISDKVDDWAIQRIAELSRQHHAAALMVALDVVYDIPSTSVPNADAIQRSGMPLLNLLDVYADRDHTKLRVAPWDDHPNPAGHRLVADRLYKLLTPLLKEITPERRTAVHGSGHVNS